jgi:WD40 repeat protein
MLRCIGSGSYGEVWLARNATGQYRAAKVLYRDRFESDRPYEREFAGITRFEPISRTHDGFVDILQVGRNDPARCFYYVMELADDLLTGLNPNAPSLSHPMGEGRGEGSFDPAKYEPRTLSATLARQGRLPVADCIRLGLALTAALEHLHRHSLVHRDIKPSNIIYVNGQPKLADVGTVADTSEARSIVGTRGYMPNEGAGFVQGDLYALGKVLYVASTGHGVDDWPNPLTSLEQLPDREEWNELNEVINKACDPDPKRRYASAAEMQAELALLQSGRSLQRQRLLEKRLRQAGWALVGIVLLGLAGLLIQQTRLRAERELVKAATRQSLLLNLEKEIRSPHAEGWSDRAWIMASNAARFGFDTNLQSQAAASLAGLDARLVFQTDGIGGSSVALDHEGNRVLFGSPRWRTDEGQAHLLDLATTHLTAFAVTGAGPVAFLADGTPVQFSADANNHLAMWKAGVRVSSPSAESSAQPVALHCFELPNGEQFTTLGPLAMTLNGTKVAAAGRTANNRALCAVWDSTSGHLLRQLEASGDILALTPDGSFLAVGNDQGEVAVWSLVDGSPASRIVVGRLPILSLSFCRDFVSDPLGQAKVAKWLLAAGDSGGGVTIWEVPARTLRTRCQGGQYERTGLAFSSDGTLLVSGGRQPNLVWDVATGHTVATLRRDHTTGVAFSTDGKRVVLKGVRPDACVFAFENGRGIQTLRGLSRPVSKVCFSRDAQLVAAVAHDWQVGIWDLSRDRLLHVFNMPPGLVTADNAGLAFSADGSQFAFMAGTSALLIDVKSGTRVCGWGLPPGFVDELAFGPSGRLLAFHFESAALIRELIPGGDTLVLRELREFAYVCGATWSHDGSFLMVEGGLKDRFVEAVAPAQQEPLWLLPSKLLPNQPAYSKLDAAGRLVAYLPGPCPGPGYAHDLRRPEDGKLLRRLSMTCSAFNSASGLACIEAGEGVLCLRSMDDELLLLTVPPAETKPSFRPVFSQDGLLLAWGNENGTVCVYDLPKIRKRLGTLNLAWPERKANERAQTERHTGGP